jgi:hypothetical protein
VLELSAQPPCAWDKSTPGSVSIRAFVPAAASIFHNRTHHMSACTEGSPAAEGNGCHCQTFPTTFPTPSLLPG